MQPGDIVKIKNKSPYGTMKVKAVYPVGYKSHRYITVEVYHSSNANEKEWRFGLIKEFKKSELEILK